MFSRFRLSLCVDRQLGSLQKNFIRDGQGSRTKVRTSPGFRYGLVLRISSALAGVCVLGLLSLLFGRSAPHKNVVVSCRPKRLRAAGGADCQEWALRLELGGSLVFH